MPNMLNLLKMDTAGSHVIFSSLHGLELPPLSTQRTSIEQPSLVPPQSKYKCRDEVVDNFVHPNDYPDLIAFQNVLCGFVSVYGDHLTAPKSANQLSLRKLLMLPPHVNPPQKGKVVLGRLDNFKVTNQHEPLRVVDESVQQMMTAHPNGPI